MRGGCPQGLTDLAGGQISPPADQEPIDSRQALRAG